MKKSALKLNKKSFKSKTLSEFSAFLLRGNVIDLTVGVIVGGAFNKIVTSLVNDVLTPILSLFTENVDFSEFTYSIARNNGQKPTIINIGAFIASIIDFLIMGFVVFVMVKIINGLRKRAEEMGFAFVLANEKKECPYCRQSISVKALRCPYCTSALKLEQIEE